MADEIGEALQRVASAAENSNISLEKSASWISTISSITRESASTIGRSLNSVISRYESIKKTGFNSEDATKLNDVVKGLHDVGINALDSQGQLKDFADVMDLLGKDVDGTGSKFDKLSKNEQAYITTVMFGTYQRNRGLTLLKNYNDSLKNYENALNAAGAAEKKFAIYQESSQAHIDKLKSTMEELYLSAFDSTTFKNVVDTLGQLISKFGNAQSALMILGAAFLWFKGNAIKSTVFSLYTLANTLYTTAVAEGVAATATGTLTAAFNALRLAIARNPIGLLAVGLATVASYFIFTEETAADLNATLDQSVQTMKMQSSQIDDAISKYESLAAKAALTAEEKKDLIGIENTLKETLGKGSEAIDLQNKSLEENIKLINSLNTEKLRNFINENKNLKEQAEKTLNSKWKPSRFNDEIANQKDMYKAREYLNKMIESGKLSESSQKNYQEELAELNKSIESYEKIIKAYDDAVAQFNKKSVENILDQNEAFKQLDKTIKTGILDGFEKVGKLQDTGFINNFLNSNISANIANTTQALEAFNKAATPENTDKLNKSYEVLTQSLYAFAVANGVSYQSMLAMIPPAQASQLAVFQLNQTVSQAGAAPDFSHIIAAFQLLNIEVTSACQNIISQYAAMIATISGIASAESTIYQIGANEIRKEELAGGYTYDAATFNQQVFKWESQNQNFVSGARALGKITEPIKDKGDYTGGGGSGGGGGGGSSKKDDSINDLIDSILEEAEAQEKLNDEIERRIDNEQALISLHTEDAMTADEYINGLQQELDLSDDYEEQQQGIRKETELYRQALDKLIQAQKDCDQSTEKGKENYDEFGKAIDDVTEKMNNLEKEYTQLEAAQRKLYGKNVTSQIDLFNSMSDLGIKMDDAYGSFLANIKLGKLEWQDQLEVVKAEKEYIENQLNKAEEEAIKIIEDKYETQIALSASRVESLQAELDAIDAQNEALDQQKEIQEALTAMTQAQTDLADAQAKLKNVENERNTRVFQNGRWEYVANAENVKSAKDAVADALDALTDAQESYYEKIQEIEESYYKKSLQSQIDSEQKKQEELKKQEDEEKKATEDRYKTLLENVITGDKNILDQVGRDLESLGIVFNTNLGTILTNITTWATNAKNQILSVAQLAEANGVSLANITGGNDGSDTTSSIPSTHLDTGGPVLKTEPALVHAGEYMLNRQNVASLGGISGVKSMLQNINSPVAPSLNFKSTLPNLLSSIANSSNTDNSININGLNLPNVVNVDQFVRNLKQLSKQR